VWLVAALVVAALVMAVWGTVRVLRRLFVLLFVDGPAPARLDSEVIVLSEMPTGGLMYRVRFFDGTYEQLTDREIAIVVDSGLPYEVVDRQLAALAAQLASAVYARDGQVCFRPRLVLVNAAGTAVREWTAPTWS
jgi:hypothetical protein